jgi:pyruvate dehydrogenase E1 component
VQDYVRAHGWGLERPEGRMVALLGDAEMDEGNIFEALLEGWKHGLRNTWWVIDYNRQSLDAVIREGLYSRFEGAVLSVRLGRGGAQIRLASREAFREPGGERLRDWIDTAPNQLYSALTFQGGAAWRRRLLVDLADSPETIRIVESRSDAELGRLMTNLAGHDLPTLLRTFEGIDHDRPTVFITYTIKGFGLPLAGHKDNHAGLLTPKQLAGYQEQVGVRPGHEWERFEALSHSPEELQAFLDRVPFNQKGTRRHEAPLPARPGADRGTPAARSCPRSRASGSS